ncbi:LolA-like outer membrane lipoprotein chaperone [Helicobacter canis]|uniref:LolA-like outer membrane lipoprotein chaperone n=1 Tax=Helicobacter canis TaxID=29419 RepID=UPI0026F0F162|nr:LolA-like outer membrane lipoprotein chaperone [Helicobacter canis]
MILPISIANIVKAVAAVVVGLVAAISQSLRVFICAAFSGIVCNVAYGYGEHIKTLQANFTQRTVSQESILVYGGKLYIKAPSQVKWVYETPIQKEIYIETGKATIYEPALEQVSVGKTKIDFLEILHKAKRQQDGSYTTDFEGTRYVLIVDGDIPRKLTFTDEFDNVVEIALHNVRLNGALSDEIFVFVPPVGVDIIEQ